MRLVQSVVAVISAGLAAGCASATGNATRPTAHATVSSEGFVDRFDLSPTDFAATGHNEFFSLEPGDVLKFEGVEDGEPGTLVVTVLPETLRIDGVETRVIEERESANGQLVELSRNYFAIAKATKDVYYFGEDIQTYKDGKPAGKAGSWHSGVDGAHYGMFMPASPAVGAKYFQELAPGVAMDRFEVSSLDQTVRVPAGAYRNCLKTRETSPLESDTVEFKLYARNVGLVVDGGMKLTEHRIH